MQRILALAGSFAFVAGQAAIAGSFVQTDDVVFGINASDPAQSIELIRGAADEGGVRIISPWEEAFIQSMEFDNLGGIQHNPVGNLLGATFGTVGDGGMIFSFGTCADCTAGSLIGSTGVGGVTLTRLGGLSVSPDNTRIAVAGYDSGKVIVFDYVAGDGAGGGEPDLANGRETAGEILFVDDTQGTRWLDDDTVIAFATSGEIHEIDAVTMESVVAATVDTIDGAGPGFTSLEYQPAISPYVYAHYSAFAGSTRNLLFVLDPNDDWALVTTVDFSGSANTGREIAFDSQGNLFVSTFTNAIEVFLGAADPAMLTDDGSIDHYESDLFGSFSGLDVASGMPRGDECAEDFDGDGEVATTDLLQLLAAWGPCAGCAEDLDGDGMVGTTDLLQLLAAWGDCA